MVLLGVLGLALNCHAQQQVALKNLELSKVRQEYGSVYVNNNKIELHARSQMKIKLDGKAERFHTQLCVKGADVDMKDSSLLIQPVVDGNKLLFKKIGSEKRFVAFAGTNGVVEKGSVILLLKADGKEIYNSGVVRQGEAQKEVGVDLRGVKMLEVLLEPTEDGMSGDNVILTEPTFSYRGDKPVLLDM